MTVGGVGGTYILLGCWFFIFSPPSPPILILGQSSCDLCRKDVTELWHRCCWWPGEDMSDALAVPSSFKTRS